jgi:hypothetical protein
MTSSEQLDFFLLRVLLELPEAGVMLGDVTTDHVVGLVEAGKLRAVDIASRRSDSPKERCLRIYRYSVEHLLLWPKQPFTIIPVAQMMPHGRPQLLRRELAWLMSCTDRHVANLDLPRSGNISLASFDRLPRYPREGVVKFLTDREAA